MKKLLLIIMLLPLFIKAQETPPTGVNFKQLMTGTLYWDTSTSQLWIYKGSIYGWHQLARYSDKVDKVSGKSLLDDSEITRLLTLSNYTHPATHPATIIVEDATHRFVTDAEKATWGGSGGSFIQNQNASAQSSSNFWISGSGQLARLGIGGNSVASTVYNVANMTGGVTAVGFNLTSQIRNDVTSNALGYYTNLSTQASAFTVGSLRHFWATQGSIGAGSAITNQFGFQVDASVTGATNNYGFYSAVPAGSTNWNFYGQSTANNHFNGSTGIGTTTITARLNIVGASGTIAPLRVASGTLLGSSIVGGIENDGTNLYYTNDANNRGALASLNRVETLTNHTLGSGTVYAGGTVGTGFGGTGLSSIGSSLQHLRVNSAGTALEYANEGLTNFSFTNGGGVTGTVTNATTTPTLSLALATSGTTSYIQNQSASDQTASSRISGTAQSGKVQIGSTASTTTLLTNNANLTGGTSTSAFGATNVVQSDVTSNAFGYNTALGTQAASFTLGSLRHFYASQGTIGAGSTVTNQYGFQADASITGATNNYGFYSAVPAGATNWNIYAQSTANNHFNGSMGIGTTTITARLNIVGASGTIAPLRIASGTLLGSSIIGGIENDGTNLNYTDDTNTRYKLATLNKAETITNKTLGSGTIYAGGTVGTGFGGTGLTAIGSALQVLRTNAGATALEWATLSATAAGSTTQIQYNNAGSMGASSDFTWDNTNKKLRILPNTGGANVATLSFEGSDNNKIELTSGTTMGFWAAANPRMFFHSNASTVIGEGANSAAAGNIAFQVNAGSNKRGVILSSIAETDRISSTATEGELMTQSDAGTYGKGLYIYSDSEWSKLRSNRNTQRQLVDFLTDVQNTGTSPTTLFTYATAANLLAVNGQRLKGEFSVERTSTNFTSLGFSVFGTSIFSEGESSATYNRVVFECVRTGSTSLKCTTTFFGGGSVMKVSINNITATLSSTNAITLSGTGTATGEIVGRMGSITWVPEAQ